VKGFRFFPTLRARLVFWFIIICLVPLLALTTFIYFHRVQTARELIYDKLSAVTSLRTDQINALLDDLSGDSKTLVNDGNVRKAAQSFAQRDGGTDAENGARVRATFLEYLRGHDYVVDASLVSEQGQILISTSPERTGAFLARPETAAMALHDRRSVFGECYLTAGERSPYMDIATPVAAAKGRERCALVLRLDMRRGVYDILENRTGMGKTGESLLVDRNAVALSELRWQQGAILKQALTGRPARFASLGRSGIMESTDYRGEKVLAAYTYIPRTGWGLVCKQDLEEVYRPLKNFLFVNYGLVALIALVVGFFAFYLAREITRPIRNLARASAEIGGGDYEARVEAEGSEELMILAGSFNAMAGDLEKKMGAQHGLAEVSEPLVQAGNLQEFFRGLLPVLLRVTGADMAAAFIGESGNGEFSPIHAVGADAAVLRKFSRDRLEGELGIVLSDEGKIRLTQPDESCRLRFVSAFGEYLPNEILTLPITAGGEVRAFISLATLRTFTPVAREILEQAVLPLNAGFSRILAAEDVLRLAGELSSTNAELTQQSEELRQQATELARQSEELYRRNRTLDEQRLQLEEATRLKSEFLSNMSHELRTPLNSVLALTRVLEIQGADRLTDEEKGYLSIVERNGRNLLSLINDILDLSKIESGRVDLLFEKLPAGSIAREVINGLQQLAREKGIRIELETRGTIPPVVTDGKRLRQILQNLIGNAVKFTAQGGVTVRVRGEDGEVVIEVEDTGIGIPSEHLETIFDEFRQVDGSTSRSYEGTGLGLAIVRKAVRLLGGEVAVRSRFGEGSLFTVRLPLDGRSMDSGQGRLPQTERVPDRHDGLVRPLEKPGRQPLNTRAGTGTRLLLVEDSEAAIIQVRCALESAGFTVDTVTGGQQAVDYLKNHVPDGIVLDLMMPEVDGFQVLQALRTSPLTSGVPVMVVTAKTLSPEEHRRLKEYDVRQVVQKGDVNQEELLTLVLEMLGNDRVFKAAVPSRVEDRTLILPATTQQFRSPGGGAVLAVDDNRDNIEVVKAVLGKDYTVLGAEDGEEGLMKAQTDNPSLILLDMQLPKKDGMTLLRELKADAATRDIPVIAMTACAMAGDRERFLAAGCAHYLSKPYRIEELESLVRSIVPPAGEN
jgi:signal transduction histidine kinase/DNA-binding response OmpR family regulator/HAMP domain-containing protein